MQKNFGYLPELFEPDPGDTWELAKYNVIF